MAQHHDHEHTGHSHSHVPEITSINKAFVVGIVLNLAYVVVQVGIGLHIHSLSLLSDAGHNFLDVAGLALAMLAFKLAKSKGTEQYTYGYRKSSILISLFNASVLLISIGAIGYETVRRFQHPQVPNGSTIAIIAGIGIVINSVSALLFFRNRDKDINIQFAFLHLASDALVSLGLVAGGILIHYTHLFWIDPLLSIIICLVIIASTWALLRNSLRLSLDGVPNNVDMAKLRETVLATAGVLDFYHLHVWAISTTQNAMTGHLQVANELTNKQVEQLKHHIKHQLEHLNIQHATLEITTEKREATCEVLHSQNL